MNKKFRFWSKKDNKFVNLPSVWVNWGGELMAGIDDDIVIQQWTGLKDKNGKEICEGDILATHIGNVYVEYFNGNNYGQYRCIEKEGFHRYELNQLTTYQVIGNIFENPELLENK